eukprot:m.261107 g.261107  ORF g.261107 m.261107 type:complete len:687 (-) comp22745_c3_seq1:76-2136(-)
MFCVLALALLGSVLAVPSPKALSGPYWEFSAHQIPSVLAGATTGDSAAFTLELTATGNSAPSVSQPLLVDSSSSMTLAVFSPVLKQLQVALSDPSGAPVALSGTPATAPVSENDALNEQFTGTTYTLNKPQIGTYTLTLSAPAMTAEELAAAMPHVHNAQKARRGMTTGHAMVVLYNDSPDLICTHLTHYESTVGSLVGLNTRMIDIQTKGLLAQGIAPPALQDVISMAELDVTFPDGHVEKTAMHDDGLHFDGEANDGAYGAQITPTQSGEYVMTAVLKGTNAAGAFERTTEHYIQVVQPTVSLTGKAQVTFHPSSSRVSLQVGVTNKSPAAQYRVYAEVYGTSTADASQVPVAWASTITASQTDGSFVYLPLEMDLSWFAQQKAAAPVTLKNVYVQEINYMIPMTQQSSVEVAMAPAVAAHINASVHALLARGYKGEITKVMRQGVPPVQLQRRAVNRTDTTAGLVLVHGYCSPSNPFLERAQDFTDAFYFSDPNQGRSNDAFAQLIAAFADSNGLDSFGLIGFSQGGMAITHLANYYHTGLDSAVGLRRLQSLATPYGGNSGMGLLDLIKRLFNIGGCDTVYDMSPDGAALWQAGITTETRQELNFYYTQYDKVNIFGGWCNFFMNLVLEKPNDGVVEAGRAPLPGAINRGLTIGQCHAADMAFPFSPLDATRNQEMNTNAAR